MIAYCICVLVSFVAGAGVMFGMIVLALKFVCREDQSDRWGDFD